MNLYSEILETYPELTANDFAIKGVISLKDDADGLGAYIEFWNYEKPIPKNLKLGK